MEAGAIDIDCELSTFVKVKPDKINFHEISRHGKGILPALIDNTLQYCNLARSRIHTLQPHRKIKTIITMGTRIIAGSTEFLSHSDARNLSDVAAKDGFSATSCLRANMSTSGGVNIAAIISSMSKGDDKNGDKERQHFIRGRCGNVGPAKISSPMMLLTVGRLFFASAAASFLAISTVCR